jgi:hypothetical protein
MGTYQDLFCMVCGKAIKANFQLPGFEAQGLCGRRCNQELNWRKALCLTDSYYRPDPHAIPEPRPYTPPMRKINTQTGPTTEPVCGRGYVPYTGKPGDDDYIPF